MLFRVDCRGELAKAGYDMGNLLRMWYLTNYKAYRLGGTEPPPRRYGKQYIKAPKSLARYFGYFPEDLNNLLDGLFLESLKKCFYNGGTLRTKRRIDNA